MKSIIKELWYGNIDPHECEKLSDSPEMKELSENMVRHKDALISTLTAEQKQLLEQYADTRNEYESQYQAFIFEYAFKLGAQMAFEMMAK